MVPYRRRSDLVLDPSRANEDTSTPRRSARLNGGSAPPSPGPVPPRSPIRRRTSRITTPARSPILSQMAEAAVSVASGISRAPVPPLPPSNDTLTTIPEHNHDTHQTSSSRDAQDDAQRSTSRPPHGRESDNCGVCLEPLSPDDNLVLHADHGINHRLHRQCVKDLIKSGWKLSLTSSFNSKITSRPPPDENGPSMGEFLKCPICRQGIHCRRLLTPNGEFIVPKTDFYNEIKTNLEDLFGSQPQIRLRESLKEVKNLIENFNVIYHHDKNALRLSRGQNELPSGNEPFARIDVEALQGKVEDYIRTGDNTILEDVKGRLSTFTRASWLPEESTRRDFEQLYRRVDSLVHSRDVEMSDAEESPHRDQIPAQGNQPRISTQNRHIPAQGDQPSTQIYRIESGTFRGINRSAFFVLYGGEWLEILWYQHVRLGGRFILAKHRQSPFADVVTTQPLSKFPPQVKEEFERFCNSDSSRPGPVFVAGTRQCDPELGDYDPIDSHLLADLKFLAFWNVGRSTYVSVTFEDGRTDWKGTILDSWSVTVSELRRIYDRRGAKYVDQKVSIFREQQGLPSPVSSRRSRSSSSTDLAPAQSEAARSPHVRMPHSRSSSPQFPRSQSPSLTSRSTVRRATSGGDSVEALRRRLTQASIGPDALRILVEMTDEELAGVLRPFDHRPATVNEDD